MDANKGEKPALSSESSASPRVAGAKRSESSQDGGSRASKLARMVLEAKEFRVDRHTDAATVREHCNKLREQGNKEGLKDLQKQLKIIFQDKREKSLQDGEIWELYDEAVVAKHLLSMEQEPMQPSSKLGRAIQSMGLGSSAGQHTNRKKVDDVLTSYSESVCIGSKRGHVGALFLPQFSGAHLRNPTSN